MKENINEHDMTKKMMSIMRGGFKTLLKEEETATPQTPVSTQPQQFFEPTADSQNDADDDKDTITLTKGDPVFNDELKKLQNIDTNVYISKFKIYPQDNNAIIEGTFLREKEPNSGIKFVMDLRAGEIEITQANVELTDEVSEVLKQLKGHYSNFKSEWARKLVDEYKANTDYDDDNQNV
jgi:hypothetical protein